MQELTEGKWTNANLAAWFGVKPKTFCNTKNRKLKELKYYADFYEEKGKVVITKVLNPVYSKTIGQNYQKVKEKVDEVWSEDGLDTCARVGNKIYQLLTKEDDDFNLKNSTVINYTLKGRNELYGKPFIGGGQIGNCIYIWCKRDEDGNYFLLTEEENEIKQKIQKKYFGDTTEKQILVKEMIESGEITKEEAWGVLEELTHMNKGRFLNFLSELQAAIGCQVVKGTLIERGRTDENNFLENGVIDGKLIKEEEFDF